MTISTTFHGSYTQYKITHDISETISVKCHGRDNDRSLLKIVTSRDKAFYPDPAMHNVRFRQFFSLQRITRKRTGTLLQRYHHVQK